MDILGLIVIAGLVIAKVLFNVPLTVKHHREDDQDLYEDDLI